MDHVHVLCRQRSSPSSSSLTQKPIHLSKNKSLLSALKKVGIKVKGTEGDMEVDDKTSPTEHISEEVAFLQKSYDEFVTRCGAETPAAKAFAKQLDAARQKTGQTAQAKTAKDLAAANYQEDLAPNGARV